MNYLSLIIFSLITFANAAPVTLPLGGKISIDEKNWNVQETRAVTGTNVLLIGHKTEKDLHGFILDGTVKDVPQCEKGKTTVCERVVPMNKDVSYQILAQRFHGKNAYQNYVFAFTFPKSQEEKYLPLLKKLKSRMEFVK